MYSGFIVCTAIFPFQTLEHIDEPRAETKMQEDLFDLRGRQLKGWTNNLFWDDPNVTMNVTQFVEVFPSARADNRLRAEPRRLPFLAHYGSNWQDQTGYPHRSLVGGASIRI
jgi:hypothetical protein